MWSRYDENLNENNFLVDIKKNHGDIINKASEESWIICIPRTGVFDSELSDDVILDHVLIHGLGDNYCTLSKKQVVIKNGHIFCDVTCCQGGTEILFEETFYINKISKYTVWCIDQPLFLRYKFCDSHKSRTLEDLSDCVDFLWAESLGHSLLNEIKHIVDNFIKQHEELASESLQTVKEYVGELYSQCLQLGFKRDALRTKSMSSNIFLENFKLAIEAYMQHCLGRHLIFAVNTSQYQSDAMLNKIIRNSADVELEDLGIQPNFLEAITLSKRELSKINSCNTILDKVNCLKMTFSTIYKNSEDFKTQITSDNILELLVYLILKLNINNWMSNIIFMKEFRLSFMDNSDQYSFVITNLEAAIEYIKSNHFLDIMQSKTVVDPNYLSAKLLSDKLSSGEMKPNVNIALSRSNNSESSLCHPLCHCDKCQEAFENEENNSCSQIIAREENDLLIVATKLGYCNVVEYLLKHRHYDVNVKDSCQKTCLHYAAAKGHQDILLLAVICKASVNAVDDDRNTALHLACLNGHENCVKALMYATSEVELNIGNNFGDTPLHLATKWGFLDIVKILLENGASMIIENKQKQTALSLSPNYHVWRQFKFFGSRQSTQFHKEIEGSHVLSNQEKYVYTDHCKEHGQRPKDIEQYKKIDLLLKAIESNDFPLACFYLGFTNNSLHKTNETNCHPLCSCENCNTEEEVQNDVRNTYSNTFNINMCNVKGYTPLHVAAKYGRTDVLRILLDSGAFPNVKTYKTLYTPLHLACMNQRIQTVRELLKCGNCNVDECDAEGNTPLFYATANNDVKVVEILISNGADCTRKNYSDRSPVQECENKMHYRLLKVLKNSLPNVLEKSFNSTHIDKELF